MSRKSDLERNIRESYGLIRDAEAALRAPRAAASKLRLRHNVEEQWALVKEYIAEYMLLHQRLNFRVPADITQIAISVGQPPQTPAALTLGSEPQSGQYTLSGAIRLFYSYSHRDETLRDELAKHLKLLERAGLIQSWHDRRISAGCEWRDTIDENLEKADIILLLVSPDFIASDYCYDVELRRALELERLGKTRVLPIIVRTVSWQKSPLGKLQALPTDGRPVDSWLNRDAAWSNVESGIRKVVEELQGPRGRERKVGKLPIASTLLAFLNYQRELCQQKNVPFFTPSLLLSLLEIPEGVMQYSLDALKAGLAREYKQHIRRYLEGILPRATIMPFKQFDWEEREDIRRAQRLAAQEGSPVVTDKHLLLALLETRNKTINSLRNSLGEEQFDKLLHIVRGAPTRMIELCETDETPLIEF